MPADDDDTISMLFVCCWLDKVERRHKNENVHADDSHSDSQYKFLIAELLMLSCNDSDDERNKNVKICCEERKYARDNSAK